MGKEEPSSLRFKGCVENAWRVSRACFIEFGAFSNVVMEYVFRATEEERGIVDCIVYSDGIETEKGVIDRMARVDVKKDNKHYYFYVFAETEPHALLKWEITGRSVFMEGRFRMPDYETEMIWV